MKRTKTSVAFLGVLLAATVSAPVISAERDEVVEQLKTLIREIRVLQESVKQLEQRVEDLELDAHRDFGEIPPIRLEIQPGLFDVPGTIRTIDPPFNLQDDKGLYIFPGLDAPPLSPADIRR